MTTISLIRQLFGHMEWADAVVWRTVLTNSVAASDPALRERLVHIHTVQGVFLHLWRQEAIPKSPGPSASAETAQVADWGRECHGRAAAYIAGLDEQSLDDPVSIPWAEHLVPRFGRLPASVTLAQAMLQVPWHSSHHRGQVNLRLRELGCDPPLVDFIAWVWLGQPKADWNPLWDSIASDEVERTDT